MVRAILEGKKTQTRRVLNRDKLYNGFAFDDPRIARACPYGQPGDKLWVRESMKIHPDGVWHYSADDATVYCKPEHESDMIIWAHHKETGHCPSIFMPRWASRITLEVTGVRVERLHDISEDDAIAEGMEVVPIGASTWSDRHSFMILWNRINGARGYSWESNCWVWVVEFKRVDHV